MLFLAVFCGFLAELRLEHYIEHQREKKYMITLLEDLKIDTARLQALKDITKIVAERRDSVKKYLKPPVNTKHSAEYLRESMLVVRLMGYTYNDRTVDQLRSAGNYRLIRKKNVTDSLIKFDTRMRGTFTKNYDNLYENRMRLMQMQTSILDGSIISRDLFDEKSDFLTDSVRRLDLSLLKPITDDRHLLFTYYNSCLLLISFNEDVNAWADKMKESAENLIKLVENEYNLK